MPSVRHCEPSTGEITPGPAGETGVMGVKGVRGVTGVAGFTGEPGVTGETGFTGTPLFQTNFLPLLMQVYLTALLVVVAPTFEQAFPARVALNAGDVDRAVTAVRRTKRSNE